MDGVYEEEGVDSGGVDILSARGLDGSIVGIAEYLSSGALLGGFQLCLCVRFEIRIPDPAERRFQT